uniref:Adhesive plaque matrix protein-like n=1 Tax=Cacopsylla melanoneura TaxID=428564 RepID=A0A8D8TCQ4_9HEMI
MTNVIPGLVVLTISLLIHFIPGVESGQIPSDKVPQVVKDAIPKHIKAMYKAHRAIYAKDYAHKLIPIPNKPPPLAGDKSTTAEPGSISRSTRSGRQAWTSSHGHYGNMGPPRGRRRKVRPPPIRMTYNMPPSYAPKYKGYAPMYKKRPRHPPPRMVAPGRYPPKYRMPIHNNVIEPDDYQDEEILQETMEEEPVVMESMGPASYAANSMPVHGSMGQHIGMMGPSQNEDIYYDDEISSMRMQQHHPVEYMSDDDYVMRHSDYYSNGYNSGLRARGTQIRAVKPAPIMYSSRYRDMRNSESRYEPEIIQRIPIKQMPAEYASNPQYMSPQFSSAPQFTNNPNVIYSEPEPKYLRSVMNPYRDEPETKFRSSVSNAPLYTEPKFRSTVDDSDFLPSNLRQKSESPDYMRPSNSELPDYIRHSSKKYESVEDAKSAESIEMFTRPQSTAQPSIENNKWSGSMKFMPRPFAAPLESSPNNVSPSSRNLGAKKTQETISSNHHTNHNFKYSYDPSTNQNIKQQPSLTIHDLLLQQAKQIQQTTHDTQPSPPQGRELNDDYTNINDFMVYNGPRPGDVYKPNAQRYRSDKSRRSSGSENYNSGSENLPQPQYLRYTKPGGPDLDDMDAVLDSLPWQVKKKR